MRGSGAVRALGALVLALVVGVPAVAQACPCKPDVTLREQWAAADAVFVATVRPIGPDVFHLFDDVPKDPLLGAGNLMERGTVLKGEPPAGPFVLWTGGTPEACGLKLRTGDTFLVLAKRIPGTDKLSATTCSGTRPIGQVVWPLVGGLAFALALLGVALWVLRKRRGPTTPVAG